MTSNLSDIKRTSEGYLQNYDDWTPEIAEDIAAELNISLTPERWFVINFLRNFYDKYHTSPSIRALVTALKKKLERMLATADICRSYSQTDLRR